jgi:hypothetical protein
VLLEDCLRKTIVDATPVVRYSSGHAQTQAIRRAAHHRSRLGSRKKDHQGKKEHQETFEDFQ